MSHKLRRHVPGLNSPLHPLNILKYRRAFTQELRGITEQFARDFCRKHQARTEQFADTKIDDTLRDRLLKSIARPSRRGEHRRVQETDRPRPGAIGVNQRPLCAMDRIPHGNAMLST